MFWKPESVTLAELPFSNTCKLTLLETIFFFLSPPFIASTWLDLPLAPHLSLWLNSLQVFTGSLSLCLFADVPLETPPTKLTVTNRGSGSSCWEGNHLQVNQMRYNCPWYTGLWCLLKGVSCFVTWTCMIVYGFTFYTLTSIWVCLLQLIQLTLYLWSVLLVICYSLRLLFFQSLKQTIPAGLC